MSIIRVIPQSASEYPSSTFWYFNAKSTVPFKYHRILFSGVKCASFGFELNLNTDDLTFSTSFTERYSRHFEEFDASCELFLGKCHEPMFIHTPQLLVYRFTSFHVTDASSKATGSQLGGITCLQEISWRPQAANITRHHILSRAEHFRLKNFNSLLIRNMLSYFLY